MGCPCARARSRSCRRPARSARAGSTASTTSCCASAASSAQVLLTFFDMSARTHYLNARRTLRKLLEWRVVPVINENDTTTTDEISFGDNDFLAAQVAILVGADAARAADRHRRALHGRPARRPAAPSWSSEVGRLRGARGARHRPRGRRRSARAGCARRSSRPRWRPRPGIPTVICNGLEPGVLARGAGRASRWARASRRSPCATRASSCGCKYAKPSHGHGGRRRRRRAGAARGRDVACCRSGSSTSRGAFDAGDAVEVAAATATARSARGSATTRPTSCARCMGMKSAAGARAAAARDRGGRPPRLLRARLDAPRLQAMADHAPHSVADICLPRAKRPRGARGGSTRRPRTRALHAIADALEARTRRDPRGQRARPRGRPRGRALAPR